MAESGSNTLRSHQANHNNFVQHISLLPTNMSTLEKIAFQQNERVGEQRESNPNSKPSSQLQSTIRRTDKKQSSEMSGTHNQD